MNQILITGEEVVEKVNVKKPKMVLSINSIIVFYAFCIIVLGICMICGSKYACTQINQTVEANKKPEITLGMNDENTISINVTHIREIKTLTYQWNDEEETEIDTKNGKCINETINLIGGENTLTIVAIDQNSQKQTLKKTYKVGNIPVIEELEPVDNGVKIVVSGEQELDYLEYSWDDGEIEKIEIGEKQYEGIINAPKGKHTLKIEIIDVNGMKAELKKEVIGDTEPTVNVQSKLVEGKMAFVIDVEDDENIETLSIIHNAGEKQIIDVDSKTYHKEVPMTEGEENTIIVTAINKNGLQKTRRIRFTNK